MVEYITEKKSEELSSLVSFPTPVSDLFTTSELNEIRKEINWGDYYRYYKEIGLVKQCIDTVANFSTQVGFETAVRPLRGAKVSKKDLADIKEEVDYANRLVNLDNVMKVAQVKRHIWGNAPFQMVKKGSYFDLHPLKSTSITIKIDEDAWKIKEFTYIGKTRTYTLKPKDVFYMTYGVLDFDSESLLGMSAIKPVEKNLLILQNLQKDLLYSARTMWAPLIIHQYDDRGMTKSERTSFKNSLKTNYLPGSIMISNRAVTTEIKTITPDIQSLTLAKEKEEEAIIGNWGIPKALVSKEKTITRATLEHALRAFYQSTIKGEQKYLSRQIETQWYDRIIDNLGYKGKVRVQHNWTPIVGPDSSLIKAITDAADKDIIDKEQWYDYTGFRKPSEVDYGIEKTK